MIEKIREAYLRKSSHEDADAVRGLERIIVLTAIDRLWQEHLFAMDALREGIQLQRIGQKDPLVEYKNEAYAMFVELMSNIKYEVLHNLFRSTSNLQAFEKFLASLPQNLLHETLTSQRPAPLPTESPSSEKNVGSDEGPRGVPTNLLSRRTDDLDFGQAPQLEIPSRRELPKVGRNEACPCGSGRKFKNCCGRTTI